MTQIGSLSKSSFGEQLLSELRQTQKSLDSLKSQSTDEKKSGRSFYDHLSSAVKETNQMQKGAEKMATDLVTGKEQNIHETMLAATKAELNFNLMVQIRNKALQAYQEVMRMPV